MNKAQSRLISSNSRSAGLARVCLALAKTRPEATGQCHKQGKTTGADLNLHPQPVPSLTRRQACDGAAPS